MTTTAKTTKAPKAKLLRLTSRAKSPKKVKAQVRRITKLAAEAGIPTTAETLKETLEAAVEAATAAAPIVPGLDGGEGIPAEQIGEVIKPAPKAKAPKVNPEAKVEVDHSATLLALLEHVQGRATPRRMMDVTGLSGFGVNAAVAQLLKTRGLKVKTQKNPAPDPADRKNTSFLYGVEKA